MDHQELLRDYENALDTAEVNGRSILVWRKILSVESMERLEHSRKLGSMLSKSWGSCLSSCIESL